MSFEVFLEHPINSSQIPQFFIEDCGLGGIFVLGHVLAEFVKINIAGVGGIDERLGELINYLSSLH